MLRWSFGSAGLLIIALLSACGQSNSPSTNLTNAGPQPQPSGSYKVAKILCDGQESTAVPSSILSAANNQGIAITIEFSNGSGTRITNFFGCVQTVPMSPMVFSSPNILGITDDNASCQAAVSGACNALSVQCNATPFNYQSDFVIQGSSLTIQIPLNPSQSSPCGADQGTSDIEFVMTKLSI